MTQQQQNAVDTVKQVIANHAAPADVVAAIKAALPIVTHQAPGPGRPHPVLPDGSLVSPDSLAALFGITDKALLAALRQVWRAGA